MDCTFEINAALSLPAFIPAVGRIYVLQSEQPAWFSLFLKPGCNHQPQRFAPSRSSSDTLSAFFQRRRQDLPRSLPPQHVDDVSAVEATPPPPSQRFSA